VAKSALARDIAAPPRMITVGGVCDSMIFSVDEVPPLPSKVLASKLVHIVDGMALSAGYAFARLGGEAQICARVGDDHVGHAAREGLAAEGLETSSLRTVPGAKTSLAVTIVERNGHRLVVPYHDEAVDKSPQWLPIADIARADILHCDTRWVEGAEYALTAARERGIKTMLDGDVAPLDVLQRLVPLADYAVFSDGGIRIYAGCDDVETALRQVAAEHSGHVGASCGEDGYLWFEDGDIRSVPAPKVDVVDTLSAGDIFHGAFALALLEGHDIRDAARFACAAASLKCTRFGGRMGCPTRPEVDACVRATYGVYQGLK
jgi:sulfofructose kinase